MRFLQFLTMLGAALIFAACGGGTPTGTSRPGGGGSPAASVAGGTAVACTGSGGEAVSAQNTAFDPESVTVAVGSTVTWTNNDSVAHTVTFNTGPDCGQFAGGATKSATFSTAGTYEYRCTIHSGMTGTVVVQ